MKTLCAVAVLAFARPAEAQVKYPPKPGDRILIVDEAGLLAASDKDEIRRLADKVLTDKKAPIAVVTIKSLKDYGADGWPIERYAMNLFAEWGIGFPEWNYGMLLLVSVADRKARIELGAGWGHKKDSDAQRIMDEMIVPNFKKGEFSKGIREGVRGLHSIALGLSLPDRDFGDRAQDAISNPVGSAGSCGCGGALVLIVGVVIVLAVVGIVASAFSRGSSSGGCSSFGLGCLGGALGSMLFSGGSSWGRSSGGGWRSSGGGGGGWSGGSSGGGFSGGGGASGSW